jgi:hypothetical protein
MTEQVPPEATEAPEAWDAEPESSARSSEVATTGAPGVDRVLADVDGLDDLPLEEHLAVFERVHGSLRSALDAPPDDPA